MTIEEMIGMARQRDVSDIHLSEGMPVAFRSCGRLVDSGIELSDDEIREMILGLLPMGQGELFDQGEDADFALQTPDKNRQRINNHIPTLSELKLPKCLKDLADQPRGLILVTGPTGSGKSTTLAAMIDYINNSRAEHIITIEDPIEYVYDRQKSIIHQRETGVDVKDFASALRSSLREDPDVILVGEMRDYETISAALTAAETGHLVMSTLHTTGAAQTIDRIIDACPGESQSQIRTQLAGVLAGVVTQCLIPTLSGMERIAATEVLIGTDAALNLIRENKCHQLNTIMQSGMAHGMHTLNRDLSRLVAEGTISRESAKKYTNDIQDLEQYL